jgi:L-aspartate oxidase
MIEWGTKFDLCDGELELGREAGHSASRIVHAYGDATGREMARVLCERVRATPAIAILENHFLVDLITEHNRCYGALVYTQEGGLQLLWARQTILATGGCGRVWQETTNPEVATGDGLAAAWRAGTALEDMEMIQFHPTTLYVAGASRALISEAVRGEGAHLVDGNGYRFMPDYHPDAELAPRDIVSQSIILHMRKTGARSVFLDVRHLGYDYFKTRFPGITELCESFGVRVKTDLIPVRPSAHYMVGGVVADLQARTAIDGLYACGEVACSGLHGANRLASNSLLEGLVFGAVAGANAGREISQHSGPAETLDIDVFNPFPDAGAAVDLQDIATSLRSMMWRRVGIIRDGDGLAEAIASINWWGQYMLSRTFSSPAGWQIQNMLTVANLVAKSAGIRTETRGVHYRRDFPDRDDVNWMRHVRMSRTVDLSHTGE